MITQITFVQVVGRKVYLLYRELEQHERKRNDCRKNGRISVRVNKKDCYTKEDMLDYVNKQEEDALFCPYCTRVMIHVTDGEYWYCNFEECEGV